MKLTQEDICYQYIQERGGFSGELPSIVKTLLTIASPEIPKNMSATIAVSEIVTFAGNLRRNIQLDKNTLIPVNAISFVLSGSGTKKDSTVNGIRKAFKKGYERIEHVRTEDAKKAAISLAKAEGRENPESFAVYSEFYVTPPLLFAGISTEQGLFKHCNKLEAANLGCGLIYSGEMGAELQTNPNMITNLKLSSILYDIGKADVTLLKGVEGQLAPIENLPVSALFLGSQDNILFDDAIKTKFRTEFTTKLARRAFLSFSPHDVELPTYATAEALIEAETSTHIAQLATLESLQDSIDGVAFSNLEMDKKNKPLSISEEAMAIYINYKRWGKEKSMAIKADYPISKITVEHRYWAALKLAGAFTIILNQDEITAETYIDAINYIDYLRDDLPAFEDELRKDVYEQFIDYVHMTSIDGKVELPFHKLLKQGYITKGGASTPKVKELVKLANSKDNSGLYIINENSVTYEKTIRTNTIGLSYIEMPSGLDKQQRGVKVASGRLERQEATFKDLSNILNMDIAYSPFEFKDGKRKNDNLILGTKWITLDVDEGVVSDEVAHEMLSDINHHIARTSDKSNPMKYRILLELDAYITIDQRQWKKFMVALENYLAIPLDKLPMSQIYYAWEDRDVLSVTGKTPLETKDLLLIATEVEADSNYHDTAKMSKNQKSDLLNNPMETFGFAYEAADGSGSRALVSAMYYMHKLGATQEDAEVLLHKINQYWVVPLEDRRFQHTILSQIPGIWGR